MRGGVAQTLHVRQRGNRLHQKSEVHRVAIFRFALIGIHVLPEQGDFAHTLCRQAFHFAHHVGERSRHLFAARIGHHAVRAVFTASFHDGNESGAVRGLCNWQVIELLDLGKTDVDLRLASCAPRRNELRQAMQCLRTEHHIHVRRTFDNGLAFLAGNAAADPDQQIRVFLLQGTRPSQIGEHLLLRLLANGTGIEQNDVGLFRLVGLHHAFAGAQHVRHLVRVVLVHLAAISLYVEFRLHTGYLNTCHLMLKIRKDLNNLSLSKIVGMPYKIAHIIRKALVNYLVLKL